MRGRQVPDTAAARAPPHRHLQRGGCGSRFRAELRAAGSSLGDTEGRTGNAAGGDATPSLRASAAAATAGAEEEEEEGAEQRRQAPQPSSRPPPPPRARARAPEAGGSRGARSPAASAEASAARALSTPNRKRAPAPAAPTNRCAPVVCMGGPVCEKIPPPPRDWPRAAREGRDHLKPRASQKEQERWTAHARALELPPREGRPEAQRTWR